MIRTGFKIALLATAVACYIHPQFLLYPFIGSGLDSTDLQALVRVLRGLLTLLSYGLASCRPSWFYVLVAVAALQLGLLGLKIADTPMIGWSVADQETMLFVGIVMCFGAIMSISLFGDKSDNRARFRNRLVAFYTKHNPDKLQEVDELVEKYELNEELLFQRLHRKYNALDAGRNYHSMMKKIDENEFLYEEEEEERDELDDEMSTDLMEKEAMVHPMDKKTQRRCSKRGRKEGFEGDSKKSMGVVGSKTRQLEFEDYDILDGTPPVSPRTAKTSAYTHRQSSTLINGAIMVARQTQNERVERRIANITSKKGDGYAGH